ncbi:hypothetical protein KDH_71880 [Dictyobacter sp. S3.2.2.5]|uniref:Protein kinase domain-containing protein n=1 Tax=Dictyobacter halimunensis TaxID=3026934 RepID=A0ABQ6G1I5_9CHLR|nr:hypothetical protein KDH_71880 [Dictyobacter sp. S3.2.2.5]
MGLFLKGRYRIKQTIGQGGMGSVYSAEDEQLGRRLVAIKELNYLRLSEQEKREAAVQFQREAHLLAGLQHPNLPNIYDYFEENGHWYLVMSLITGETLESYQQKALNGRLPVGEVVGIGIELSNVLEYLHSHQPPIIFRDLKPANIMRTANGHLYLIDFGIARHFKPDQSRDTVSYGSAGFSPPEQYGGAQTNPRSDIYSLGVTLYALLSGYDPSRSLFNLPPLAMLVPDAPPRLVQLISQMVEFSEEMRPASAAAVRHTLQEINAPTGQSMAPPPPLSLRPLDTPPPPPPFHQSTQPAFPEYQQMMAPPPPNSDYRPYPESALVGSGGQQQIMQPFAAKAPSNSPMRVVSKTLGVLGCIVGAGFIGIGVLGSFTALAEFTNYTSFATQLWVGAFCIIAGWIVLRIGLLPFRDPMKIDASVAGWRRVGIEGGIFLGGAMGLAGVVCTFFLMYNYYLLNHRADLYSAGVGGSILYVTSGLYILLNSRLKPPKISFSQNRREAIALTGSLLGASFGVPGLLMILAFAGGTMVPGVILLIIGVFLTFITRIRRH